MLAGVTLLAYDTPDVGLTYLIEELENGIHPKAVETVYQSLTSSLRGPDLVRVALACRSSGIRRAG